jgi:hypothetical protein
MKAGRFLIAVVVILSMETAGAQFQKKFSAEVRAVGVAPRPAALRADRFPYLFSNFQYGHGTQVVLAYNLSRKISLGVSGSTLFFLKWVDPQYESPGDDSFFTMFEMAPRIRYRLLKSKWSPIVEAGAGFTIYGCQRAATSYLIPKYSPVNFTEVTDLPQVSIDEVLVRQPGFRLSYQAAPSISANIGVGYKFSQTIEFNLLGGYSSVFAKGDFNIDQRMRYLSISLTANVQIGKSKTI